MQADPNSCHSQGKQIKGNIVFWLSLFSLIFSLIALIIASFWKAEKDKIIETRFPTLVPPPLESIHRLFNETGYYSSLSNFLVSQGAALVSQAVLRLTSDTNQNTQNITIMFDHLRALRNDFEQNVLSVEPRIQTHTSSLVRFFNELSFLDDDVQALGSRISVAETSLSSLNVSLTQSNVKISTLENDVSNLRQRASSIESNVQTLDSSVQSLAFLIQASGLDVGNAFSLLERIQVNIANLESRGNLLNVSFFESMELARKNVFALGLRVDWTEVHLLGLNGSLSDVFGRLDRHEWMIGLVNASVLALGHRVHWNEMFIVGFNETLSEASGRLDRLQLTVSYVNSSVVDLGHRVDWSEAVLLRLNGSLTEAHKNEFNISLLRDKIFNLEDIQIPSLEMQQSLIQDSVLNLVVNQETMFQNISQITADVASQSRFAKYHRVQYQPRFPF